MWDIIQAKSKDYNLNPDMIKLLMLLTFNIIFLS